ncbi:MAG TPA: translocation/assembly module TamB domain-containing protein, partial [Mucilaginibacter sp.]|nr:translocation/assembly module TamB domain-containing protein [Mucilaginibacter sp.]
DFIKFVSHNDTTKATLKPKPFNGVSLNFDLSVDEKSIVKITTDYGKLEGSGVANNLKLNISSQGDFTMFGDFLITTGKFEFIAKNIISKNFQITQGGTIRWTGNPNNAEINMKALYEVRTDIKDLYSAAGIPLPQELVLVQANLILTKSLLQPNIDFDFNFPTDPSIKENLSTYLSDYNNRTRQALSIIATRRFTPGGNNNTFATLNTASEAVSELAFNKLNTLISQSNTIKSLDLNIRSFNDASASLRLFNERVVLSGSLYSTAITGNDLYANNNSLFNSSFNNLSKDFSAQYYITKNGNLTARYSYRLLNGTVLNTIDQQLTAQYVNGLGLVYQRDFDTFGEFLRTIFGAGKKKQPVNPLPQPTNTPATGSTGGNTGNANEKSDDNDQ